MAALVDKWGALGRAERGETWCFGADELYLRAGLQLPPEAAYGSFDQFENGVGAVRFLQRAVREGAGQFGPWRGKRIGVVTGTSMGALMPQVLEPLRRTSGAEIELIVVENSIFGGRVTTAGLLPGRDMLNALKDRADLDLALIPGEAVNDDQLFIDNLPVADLGGGVPMPIKLSKYFVDALDE